MALKVTIQDIATELGLSRNTVSKALNNTGVLADATKDKILQKATEMGYKHFAYINPNVINSKRGENREIALFTCSMPNNSHFASHLLNTFQEKISEQGYRLSIYMIRENELETLSMPSNYNSVSTDAIICIEMFNLEYSKKICELGVPTLFVDTVANTTATQLNADLLYMENHDSIYKIVTNFIEKGIKNIGFAGDIYNCQSFYERWCGYKDALADSKIELTLDNCFIKSDEKPYGDSDWLSEELSKLIKLPEVFVCANDFVAIDIMRALKKLDLNVPDDIMICGFDNSAESRIIEPHLTTVHIPSDAMGYIAAEMILSRIEHPDMPYRSMHVKTDIKYRASTRD